MLKTITMILGFLFSFICVYINYLLYHKTKKINLINTFIFALTVFNGLIPILLINKATSNSSSRFLNIIEGYNSFDVFLYYTQNLILLISAVSGWIIIKEYPRKTIDNLQVSRVIDLNYKTIKKVSVFSLILSIVSYYIYSRAYGGFISLLNYTSAIRSGIIKINNPFSFLQKVGGFSTFSTLLFSGLLLEKKQIKSDLPWLIFSLFFSTYYLYSLGGRLSMVAFFTVLVLGCIFYRYQNRITIGLIIKIGTVTIGTILGLYYITNIFTRASMNFSLIDFFIHELSFPFASFKMVYDFPGIFLYKHVLLAFLYFLPTTIWSSKLGFDTATSFNTFLYMGARKGENGVTGSVPLDMLSFSWLEGGSCGVLIIGMLFGILLGILEKKIDDIPNEGVKAFIFSYIAIHFAVIAVNYGDTVHVIQGDFAFIIGFIILMFLLKRNASNVKKYSEY